MVISRMVLSKAEKATSNIFFWRVYFENFEETL